jgi:hypothetical protein
MNIPIDAHRCPICDRRFESRRALFSHVAYTQAHETMLEELWKHRFLSADFERDKADYREQRDLARSDAQHWQRVTAHYRQAVARLEHENDELKNALAIALNAGHRLGAAAREALQDSIADCDARAAECDAQLVAINSAMERAHAGDIQISP